MAKPYGPPRKTNFNNILAQDIKLNCIYGEKISTGSVMHGLGEKRGLIPVRTFVRGSVGPMSDDTSHHESIDIGPILQLGLFLVNVCTNGDLGTLGGTLELRFNTSGPPPGTYGWIYSSSLAYPNLIKCVECTCQKCVQISSEKSSQLRVSCASGYVYVYQVLNTHIHACMHKHAF
jgi:hypothetical protein